MAGNGNQTQRLVTAAKPLSAAGAVFVAPLGTPLPEGADAELDAAYQTLGYISEDGITNALETSSESIVAFGGDTVLTIKTEHTETFTFRPIEVRKSVLSLVWGSSNVEGDDEAGLTVRHTSEDPEACVIVFAFALNAGRKMLMCCPNAKVTEVGENAYVTNDAQGFELTVTAMVDEKGVAVYQHVSGLEGVLAAPQSKVKVTAKADGSYLGVNYADLGTFEFSGLKVTGTAKQATAQGWNGEGQDKTGYFLGFHTDNLKLLKTEKHPEGKPPDGTGDWLLLLGEESPTLSWFEVEDAAGKSDRYTVSVTAAGKVSATAPRPVAPAREAD